MSFSSSTPKGDLGVFKSSVNIGMVLIAGISTFTNAAKAEGSSTDATPLDTIVVTAARLEQTRREVIGDVSVISEKEIRARNPMTVNDILRTIPGIQISENGGPGKAASLFLRGANSNQTLLLINGVRVGSATLGTAAFQDLPVNQIERIEVLRGPASSLYGADAIGGVIQIFTKAGYGKPSPTVSIGAGSNNTGQLDAIYRGAAGGTQFAFGAGYLYTDGINAIANPNNFSFNPDRDGYRNSSVSAQVSHSFSEANEIGLNALAARGRNQYDSSFPTRNFDYRNKDELASYSVWSRNKLMPWWTSNVQVGWSNDDNRNFTPVSASNLSINEARFTTHQTQVSWKNDLRTGPGVTSIGAEWLEQKVSGTVDFNVDARTIKSVFAGYLASYGATKVQANLRNDDNSQYGSKTTGYAGVSYEIQPGWQIGGSSGTGFRAPSFNELYFPGFGNAALRPERSRNKELFARYAGDTLSAGVTGFDNRVTDLIVFTGPSFSPVNVGKANLRGVTLNADWIGTMMTIGGSFDWLSPKDASAGPNDGKLLPRRARQTATVYAATNWGRWDFRAELTGQGKRFEDAGNTISMGGYGIVNLTAGYKLAPEWTARLRIENVFDKRYELARDYNVVRQGALVTLTWAPK